MQSSTTGATAHWLALALLLACGAATEVSQQPLRQQQQQIVSQEPAESPYLLVTSSLKIYKMPLIGADSQAALHIIAADNGISAVAFHYRLGHIFWINGRDRCIKRANMDGTNITTLVMGGLSMPADLAVDWIHDKLYWSDSGFKRIEEVDLHTSERRIVVQLDSSSNPHGLAVYPTMEHGILYWTDSRNRNLQRILNTGTSHAVIHQANCVQPIALNLRQRMVYWGDQCAFSIESVLINGTSHSIVVNSDENGVQFPRGVSQFGDSVYWVQPNGIYKKTGEDMSVIYNSPSNNVLQDIQVVHPDTQPTIEQLQQSESVSDVSAECGGGCQNGGRCIFPGVCDCPTGWAGLSCSEDEDECLVNNGGCPHVCTNTDGGYHCSCHEGYTLSQNGSNCIESPVIPTSVPEIQQTATNHPSLPPGSPTLEPNIQPNVLSTSSHSTPSQPAPTSTTTTDRSPPTRTTTRTDLPHKPSTMDRTDVVPTSSKKAIPTPVAHPTTSYVNPSTTPTNGGETGTETTHGDSVVSMTSPSATQSVEFDIQGMPLPTSDSKSGMTGRTDPTISGIDRANDDAEGSNPLVFIIPVSVVAGFVLLSLAVFAFMMTYVHCKSHRQGSYSFGNPAALDIAGEVSTNTLKQGQVTRTSFRPIGSSGTSQNTPETVAILSQPRDSSRASSTISGSESFEWNHT